MAGPIGSATAAPQKPQGAPIPKAQKLNIDESCPSNQTTDPSGQSKSTSWFSTAVINLSKPVQCRSVDAINDMVQFLVIDGYKDALERYDQSLAEYKKKPSSKSAKNKLDSAEADFKKAEALLLQAGVNLFNAAILNKNPSFKAITLWILFAEYVGKASESIQLPKNLAALMNLSDEKINSEDRKILFDYVVGNSNTPSAEFSNRFLENSKALMATYNGWQNYGAGESGAFFGFLASYLEPAEYEKLQTYVLSKDDAYLSVLTSETTQTEARELHDISIEKFWQLYDETENDYMQSAPGSNHKIVFGKKLSDMNAIAAARNLSSLQKGFDRLEESSPGLSDSEYRDINTCLYLSYLSTGNKKSPLAKGYLETFTAFTKLYFKSSPTLRSTYASVLAQLEHVSSGYGFSKKDTAKIMGDICKETGCSLEGKQSVARLGDLKNTEITEVSPETLPQEVKDLLVKGGEWDLVKANIRNICFKPEIRVTGSSSYSKDTAGGQAFGLLKKVEIAFVNPDGSTLSAAMIASILVHEAAHNKFHSEAPLSLQYSTPDERHSYAIEYAFATKILPFLSKEDRAILSKNAEILKRAIKTANLILGYPDPENYLCENIKVPTQLHLEKHGAEESGLDMRYYPTNPAPGFLESKDAFTTFATSQNPNIDKSLIDTLWDIMSGKANLIVEYKTANRKIAGTPSISIERNRKNTPPLSAADTEQVVSLLTSVAAKAYPEVQIPDRYRVLGMLGRQRAVSWPEIKKSKLADVLGNPGLIDFGALQERIIKEPTSYSFSENRPVIEKRLAAFLRSLAAVIKTPLVPSSFSPEILFSSLDIARNIIRNPANLNYYRKLMNNPGIKPEDKQRIGLGLGIITSLNLIPEKPSVKLALLDSARIFLEKSLENIEANVSFVYSAATLREFFFAATM